jgi:FkbM family methyltransferase
MMNLKELKLKYRCGMITKHDYIDEMHKKHKQLFEYVDFIKDTDIGKIEINDETVSMVSRAAGIKINCNQDDQRLVPIEILNFDFYEKNELQIVIKLIENKFTVFDVGANVGWYAMNIAKIFEDIKIFAFEPVPKTFECLKKNIEINEVQNIQIFNFGFSNKNEEFVFYYDPRNSGNASIANLSESNNVETVECIIKRMDDFVYEKGLTVDLIKCDVEGAELLVFQGGMETIKRCKPIIFTEMLRKWAKKFGYHPNDIINLFSHQGYRCFVVKHDRLVEFAEMNGQTVETNFFFLHQEKHKGLISQYECGIDYE